MKKKILLLIITILVAFTLLIFFNDNVKRNIYLLAPDKLQIIYKVIFKDKKFNTKVGNNIVSPTIKLLSLRNIAFTSENKLFEYVSGLSEIPISKTDDIGVISVPLIITFIIRLVDGTFANSDIDIV